MNGPTWTVYTVKQMREFKSLKFGVYDGDTLVEGGFFSKASALDRAADMTREARAQQEAR